MSIRFFTNGKKTVRADEQAARVLLAQDDGKGTLIWTETEDPNPPKMTQEEIVAADHTGRIEIKHIQTGKVCWCDKGQCVAMLDTGWALVDPKSFTRPDTSTKVEEKKVQKSPKKVEKSPKKVESPPPEETSTSEEEPAIHPGPVTELRKVLDGLNHADDLMWNSKGEVNITSLRGLVPNVTRKEVEEAFPGFRRTLK